MVFVLERHLSCVWKECDVVYLVVKSPLDNLCDLFTESAVDRVKTFAPIINGLPRAAELVYEIGFQQPALRRGKHIPNLLECSCVSVIFYVLLHFLFERFALVWLNLSDTNVGIIPTNPKLL